MEYIRLLHDIHADNIDGHLWRGYTVLDSRKPNSIQKIQNYKYIEKPVCFVFSALGSQWPEISMYTTLNIYMYKLINTII